MFNQIVSAARLTLGATLLYNILSPEPLQGIEHPNPQHQEFIDSLCKITNLSKSVFVREVDFYGESAQSDTAGNSIIGAASTESIRTQVGQILIPKMHSFTNSDMKLILAHELGHLYYNHPKIANILIISNIALLTIPYIPFTTALTNIFFTAICLPPLYMIAERQADAFALKYVPLEILESSLASDSNRLDNRPIKKGFVNDLFELLVFRSEERRQALISRVEALKAEKAIN